MIYSAGNASAVAGELGKITTQGMQYDAGEAKAVGELTKDSVQVGDIKYGAGNAKAIKPILDSLTPKKYKTINYVAGEGASGTMDSEQVEVGSQWTVPQCTFTPPNGKTFQNWNYGKGTANPGDKIDIGEEGTLTVTAQWK